MSPRLNITNDRLPAFCRTGKTVKVWLFEPAEMKPEQGDRLGRPTGLVEKPAVGHRRNPWTRRETLGTAERVYAS